RVEALQLSNPCLAPAQKLAVVPGPNKIDLPAADPDDVLLVFAPRLHVEPEDVIRVSAKEGRNIEEVLEAVIRSVPAPRDQSAAPLQALIFDSVFDQFRGVIVYVRIVGGKIRAGHSIRFHSTGKTHEVLEVGVLRLGL